MHCDTQDAVLQTRCLGPCVRPEVQELTEAAAGADAVEDDVLRVGVEQDLEQLVHHDGEGWHPDSVLQQERGILNEEIQASNRETSL